MKKDEKINKNVHIAFDIGTSSIGWSLLDDEGNILKAGVDLFDDKDDTRNGRTRAEIINDYRRQRRYDNRKRTRQNDLTKLLQKFNLLKNDIFELLPKYSNILELKLKGLEQSLTNEELSCVLYNYLDIRGKCSFHDHQKDIKRKERISKDEFPSMKLNQFYQKYGYYKGCPLVFKFTRNDYYSELLEFLNHQNLAKEFKDRYIEIFLRKRRFEKGPGSAICDSPYGVYRKDENGKIIKAYKFIWEKSIKDCPIFKNEKCVLLGSPYSELFNLASQLNTITIQGEHLAKEDKEAVLNWYTNNWKNGDIQNLTAKIFKNLIKKYRKIENIKKPSQGAISFKPLNNFKFIVFLLLKYGIIKDINLLDFKLLDLAHNSFSTIYIYKHNKDAMIPALRKIIPDISLNDIDFLLNKLTKTIDFNKFGTSAIKQYLSDDFLNTTNNATDFLAKNTKPIINTQKLITYKEELLWRVNTSTIKILINLANAIIKLCDTNWWQIKTVILETTADKNAQSESTHIVLKQKRNIELKNEIQKNTGIDIAKIKDEFLVSKIRVWYQQNGKDIYTQKTINLKDLIDNPSFFQLDHIIPKTIRGDSSLDDLCLTSIDENKKKLNRTPYEYLKEDNNKWQKFKNFVMELYRTNKINKYKKDLLLTQQDLATLEFDFFNRQFTNTSMLFKNAFAIFQDFFINNENYKDVQLLSTSGRLTSYIRKNVLGLEKNRDFYVHHIYDSISMNFITLNKDLITLLSKNYLFNSSTWQYEPVNENEKFVDVVSLISENKSLIENVKENIKDYQDNNKFLYKRELLALKDFSYTFDMMYSISKDEEDRYNIYKHIDILKDPNIPKIFGSDNKFKDKIRLGKSLYDKLNTWYLDLEQKYNNTKGNLFYKYMLENYKDEQINGLILDNGTKIKKIKFLLKQTDNKNTILLLKDQNYKSAKLYFTSYQCRLYAHPFRVQNGFRTIIPLNINYHLLNRKTNEISYKKLNDTLKSYGLSKKDKYINITKGQIVIRKQSNDNDNKYYYVGGISSNGILLKNLRRREEGKISSISVSSFVHYFDLVKIDSFGKIIKKINMEKDLKLTKLPEKYLKRAKRRDRPLLSKEERLKIQQENITKNSNKN